MSFYWPSYFAKDSFGEHFRNDKIQRLEFSFKTTTLRKYHKKRQNIFNQNKISVVFPLNLKLWMQLLFVLQFC